MDYMELVKEALSFVCIFIAAYLAYYYAIKQLHQESVENIEYAKYQAVLQAHKSLYRLLRFTTDTENEDSILIWERPKDGGLEATYYFRKGNIRKFIKELSKEIYNEGCGIFMSKEALSLISEYRNFVYGFMLSAQNNPQETIRITNRESVERMKKIHQNLSIEIRQAINLKKRDLRF